MTRRSLPVVIIVTVLALARSAVATAWPVEFPWVPTARGSMQCVLDHVTRHGVCNLYGRGVDASVWSTFEFWWVHGYGCSPTIHPGGNNDYTTAWIQFGDCTFPPASINGRWTKPGDLVAGDRVVVRWAQGLVHHTTPTTRLNVFGAGS